MVSELQQSWIDRTITAVGGASVLSQASAREVARHALHDLFTLTGRDMDTSLQVVQQISDFTVRRRLMEMFRRSFVEVSAPFTSEVFFRTDSFSDEHFADLFDRELLVLWRRAGHDRARFDVLIQPYPNAARARIVKRLTSQAFARKRRIRTAVQGVLSNGGGASNSLITLLALLIFLVLLIITFD